MRRKRTAAQSAARKKRTTAAWVKAHPERILAYSLKYLLKRAQANANRRRQLRISAIDHLGGRCSSPTCKWINEDGSVGCTDYRVLQFDHVLGGGTQERKSGSFERLCKQVIADVAGKFQLLCANCNWIKAFVNREFKYRYEAVTE